MTDDREIIARKRGCRVEEDDRFSLYLPGGSTSVESQPPLLVVGHHLAEDTPELPRVIVVLDMPDLMGHHIFRQALRK
jgi:hypothetical protein